MSLYDKTQRNHPLRVLFINDIGFLYGAGIAQWRQVQSFLLLGHDVKALCWQTEQHAQPLPLAAVNAPGRWHGMQQLSHLHRKNGMTTVEIIDSILVQVRTFSPDLIIVGNLHGAKWSVALLPALNAVAPTVAYLHDCHFFTGRCAYPFDCPLYKTGCDHTCPTADEYPALPPEKIASAWALRQQIFNGNGAVAIAANSAWTLETARQSVKNLDFGRVVHLGLDTNTFRSLDKHTARQILGLPQDAFLIVTGSTNNQERRKGGHLLPEVIEALQDEAVFILYGHNETSPSFNNVITTDFVHELHKMPLLYSAADIFVSPAVTEAFGQVFLEAAACGTPSVGFRVGGIADVVQHGKTGRLADTVTSHALVDEIRYLIANPKNVKAYAQAARQLTEKHFSLEQQAARWQDYITQLAEHRQHSAHSQTAYQDYAVSLVTGHVREEYPKITIVTPSYNQAPFLERVIRSILDQAYPNLEYFIMDGGSTDSSVNIIKRYSERLAGWVSELDNGQANAINKGFARSTGDIMLWLNSDDILMPGSLFMLARTFTEFADVAWVTGPVVCVDAFDKVVNIDRVLGWSRGQFLKETDAFIQQESTAWRRSLWERAGGYLDEAFLACDYDLWARFFRHEQLYTAKYAIGAFRLLPEQKSRVDRERYLREVHTIKQREYANYISHPPVWDENKQHHLVAFNPANLQLEKHVYQESVPLPDFVSLEDDLKPSLRLIDSRVPEWGIETIAARDLFGESAVTDALNVLWLGHYAEHGLEVMLHSQVEQFVLFCCNGHPGPSNPNPQRRLICQQTSHRGTVIVESNEFDAPGKVLVTLTLAEGFNRLLFTTQQKQQVNELDNGDLRPLLLLIHGATMFSAPEGVIGQYNDMWLYPNNMSSSMKPTWQAHSGFVDRQHNRIYDITCEIPGWQAPADSHKLYEMSYFAGDVILEIGIFAGRSAVVELLGALANPNRTMNPQFFGVDIEAEMIASTKNTLADFNLLHYATLLHGDLATFFDIFSVVPTMVFVDGNHTYEGIHSDLTLLTEHLPSGIPVLCHDYIGGEQLGVQHAVNEWVSSGYAYFGGLFGCSALLITRK